MELRHFAELDLVKIPGADEVPLSFYIHDHVHLARFSFIEYQQKQFDRLITLIAYDHFRSLLTYENLPPQPSIQLQIWPLL